MQRETIAQRIQSDLEQKGKVMVEDYEKLLSFRHGLYALKAKGWKAKRIGERGSITGYELVEKPKDKQ